MRVGVIGINHKTAELPLREKVTKAITHLIERKSLFPSVLLATCSRLELYFSSQNLASTHTQVVTHLRGIMDEEFDHRLYAYFEDECFLHLGRVTAGLDSAILAETEIQGQVRDAYLGVVNQSIPHDLHFLFQKSLRIGKQVRNQLILERGLPNLEQAVWEVVLETLPDAKNSRVFVMGASHINQRIISRLARKGVIQGVVCSRTGEHAREFSRSHGLGVVSWEEKACWREYDWVLCGTKAPHYLIQEKECKGARTRLFVDLSVPRNIDPAVEKTGAVLRNIDQLQALLHERRRCLEKRMEMAEAYVNDRVLRHLDGFTRRRAYSDDKVVEIQHLSDA